MLDLHFQHCAYQEVHIGRRPYDKNTGSQITLVCMAGKVPDMQIKHEDGMSTDVFLGKILALHAMQKEFQCQLEKKIFPAQIYPTQINNPQHLQSLGWMTIIGVKLNQKKGQKNPEKTKKTEEDIQANINFISCKEIYLLIFFFFFHQKVLKLQLKPSLRK